MFSKNYTSTSLVARAVVNHFVAPVYLFEKVPACALLLTWRLAACRVRYSAKNASATTIFIALE
jgi:hypothetical protein